MGHIVLLGDSVFDNAAYVPDQPDVVTQLRSFAFHNGHAVIDDENRSLIEDNELREVFDRQEGGKDEGERSLLVLTREFLEEV